MIAVKVRPSGVAGARPAGVEKAEAPRRYGLDMGSFLWGLAVGTLFVAPFIWTPLGRAFAIEAIRRGAGVTRAKVEEWLEKGRR